MSPLIPIALGLGSALGGIFQGIGASKAAKEQTKAADRARAVLEAQYATARGYQQPYLAAGQTGLGRLQSTEYGVTAPGAYTTTEQQPTWTAPQFNFQADPGYQWALQQGQQSVLGSAAGRGAGLSGDTMRGLARFGEGLASQRYGEAFNRYMQGRQQGYGEYQGGLGQYNLNRAFGAGQQQQAYENLAEQARQRYARDLGLTSIGQGAAGTLGQLATSYGDQLAGLYGQRGQASAAGQAGFWGGLGNMGSNFAQSMILQNLLGGGGWSGGSGSGAAAVNNNAGYGGLGGGVLQQDQGTAARLMGAGQGIMGY